MPHSPKRIHLAYKSHKLTAVGYSILIKTFASIHFIRQAECLQAMFEKSLSDSKKWDIVITLGNVRSL